MADETTGQPAPAAPVKDTTEVKTEVKETTPPPTEVKDTGKTVTTEAKETKDTKTALAAPDASSQTKTEQDWSDDWREKMAGGDEKKLKRLQRFPSPQAVLEFGLNAEKSWKQGKDPDPFPDKGTDEEKAAWRKANSIPDAPGEYIKDFTLPDGLVIGENDKPIVDQYLADAHAQNMKPSEVQSNLAWFFKWREGQTQALSDKDIDDRSSVSEELTREWGGDMKRNLGAAYELVKSVGDEEADAIMDARLPDGTKLGNHPKIIKWLAQTSLELNPALSVIPTKGTDAMTSLKTRMTEIENVMKTDRNKYYREGLDKEYQRLVAIDEKASKRSAA